MCSVVVSQSRGMAPLWPLVASSLPSYLGSDSSRGGVCGCTSQSWPVGEKAPLQDVITRG